VRGPAARRPRPWPRPRAGFKQRREQPARLRARPRPAHQRADRGGRPAAGLEYRFLPVDGAYQSPEQIAAFAQLLQELPRPLLAFCRSGARSTRLFQAAQRLNLAGGCRARPLHAP
jgi:protein tyrosine phosphatase (PTP) superfamily phosphohydrolase (DUF442 family)